MNYCSHCGAPVRLKIPAGDSLPRHVCERCGAIHYLNPKMVIGAIPEWKDKVLLCRRAIEPRAGLWTLPAGFMENGESTAEGAARETLEEAGARVEPLAGIGIYLSRSLNPGAGVDTTYLRFAFACRLLSIDASRPLDEGIVRTVWLTPDEARARHAMHRSPLVMRTLDDFLAGRRFPLELLYAHPGCLVAHA